MFCTVHTTDEQPTATPYLIQISTHPAFPSLAQKDGSHWWPSPNYIVGVVYTSNPSWSTVSSQTCRIPLGKILN